MTRRFEHTKDGHNKWWSISVEGNSYTVSYGRIGSVGDSRTKTFATAAKAVTEAEKIVASKRAKGYEEVASKPSLPHKIYAKDDESLEGRINQLLTDFAFKYNSDISYIEDCNFRGQPRRLEYEEKYADDEDMFPLCDLAMKIDALILATPRKEAMKSPSPYVRGCAQWFSENWDPMFIHDEANVKELIRIVEVGGIEALKGLDITPIEYTPIGEKVILRDKILVDRRTMELTGRTAQVGSVWIVTSHDDTQRFVKVSERPEAWCSLL